jgi:hypothetical protein
LLRAVVYFFFQIQKYQSREHGWFFIYAQVFAFKKTCDITGFFKQNAKKSEIPVIFIKNAIIIRCLENKILVLHHENIKK